jgi:hypothetical protein
LHYPKLPTELPEVWQFHYTREYLVSPAAIDIVETMLGEVHAKELQKKKKKIHLQ